MINIQNVGRNLSQYILGEGKTTISDPKKIKALFPVIGTVVASSAVILETAKQKATVKVESTEAEHTAEFQYDDNGNLISYNSFYDKDGVSHGIQNNDEFYVYHTQPLSEDAYKCIEALKNIQQLKQYESSNTDFHNGDYNQYSLGTAKKKIPQLLDWLFSFVPNADDGALRLRIVEKHRTKGDKASIVGFDLIQKLLGNKEKSLISGLISNTGNKFTYHIVDKETNTTFVGGNVRETENYEVKKEEQKECIEKASNHTISDKKLQEIAAYIRDCIVNKDMTATEIQKASKYDGKMFKLGYEYANILCSRDGQKVLKLLEEQKTDDEIMQIMQKEGITVTKEALEFLIEQKDKKIYQNNRGRKTATESQVTKEDFLRDNGIRVVGKIELPKETRKRPRIQHVEGAGRIDVERYAMEQKLPGRHTVEEHLNGFYSKMIDQLQKEGVKDIKYYCQSTVSYRVTKEAVVAEINRRNRLGKDKYRQITKENAMYVAELINDTPIFKEMFSIHSAMRFIDRFMYLEDTTDWNAQCQRKLDVFLKMLESAMNTEKVNFNILQDDKSSEYGITFIIDPQSVSDKNRNDVIKELGTEPIAMCIAKKHRHNFLQHVNDIDSNMISTIFPKI